MENAPHTSRVMQERKVRERRNYFAYGNFGQTVILARPVCVHVSMREFQDNSAYAFQSDFPFGGVLAMRA